MSRLHEIDIKTIVRINGIILFLLYDIIDRQILNISPLIILQLQFRLDVF